MKTILVTTAVIVASAFVGYYAAVGIACLHMTAPVVQAEETCDKIQRINGTLWCMNIMQAEDDALPTPLSMGQPSTTSAAQSTYNPQSTIDGGEIQ